MARAGVTRFPPVHEHDLARRNCAAPSARDALLSPRPFGWQLHASGRLITTTSAAGIRARDPAGGLGDVFSCRRCGALILTSSTRPFEHFELQSPLKEPSPRAFAQVVEAEDEVIPGKLMLIRRGRRDRGLFEAASSTTRLDISSISKRDSTKENGRSMSARARRCLKSSLACLLPFCFLIKCWWR